MPLIMKAIILILFFTMAFSGARAQKQSKNYDTENFRALYFDISRYADSLFLHTTRLNYCTSGIVFIRFEITKNGKIENVRTNEGAPNFLDSLVKTVLTNKKIPGFKQHVQPFLLPLLYSMTSQCSVDTVKGLGPMATLLRKLPNTVELTKDGWVYSFKNMLNFTRGKNKSNYKSTTYNVLPPAEIKSPVY